MILAASLRPTGTGGKRGLAAPMNSTEEFAGATNAAILYHARAAARICDRVH
jgi:hypothetical protein